MTPEQRKQILDQIPKKVAELSWPVHQLETNPNSTPDINNKIVKVKNEIVELLNILVDRLPQPKSPE